MTNDTNDWLNFPDSPGEWWREIPDRSGCCVLISVTDVDATKRYCGVYRWKRRRWKGRTAPAVPPTAAPEKSLGLVAENAYHCPDVAELVAMCRKAQVGIYDSWPSQAADALERLSAELNGLRMDHGSLRKWCDNLQDAYNRLATAEVTG